MSDAKSRAIATCAIWIGGALALIFGPEDLPGWIPLAVMALSTYAIWGNE